jgi:23S rRNA (pseudouridine1915-N3)-methyltransferase
MKLQLITVGETYDKAVKILADEYAARINRYYKFEMLAINASNATEEGKLLLKKVNENDTVVLLDEKGKELGSVDFSKQFNQWLNAGSNVVFVIGGAYGFSETMYARANYKLSLSKMTFPHQLIRALFTEQLYRACTILRNEKYHHE